MLARRIPFAAANTNSPSRTLDFTRYLLDPIRFVHEILHWSPDPKQLEVFANFLRKRIILNWGRQSGKSTLMAAFVVYWAATRPETLVLIVGGVESHSVELFERIDHFLAAMDWTSRGQAGKTLSRRLPNRSRIVSATTGRSVRGHTASLVIMDEASLIEESVWAGVLPTLAVTKGTIMVASTPNGTTGSFYDIWREALAAAAAASATPQSSPSPPLPLPEAWFHSEYPATANPRSDRAFLDEMRRLKGESYVRQEFLCEFTENGKSLISRELVQKIFSLE